jgi:Zn-dependent protease with chaperone function
VFSFAVFSLVAAGAAWGLADNPSAFNLITVEQDAEIGKRSSVEVEKQLPMLHDNAAQRYVSTLGARLAAWAPGARFAYQFNVVDLPDINAFALPGGYIYVHRGLLERVRSEGELAAVLAHEIAHVALRQPTNQASRAYLAQAGVGTLGGFLNQKTQKAAENIVQAVGGFGLNEHFLTYSRVADAQADNVGAQIMAKAGYDPMERVRFFETMRRLSGSDPGQVAQFLNDHPAPTIQEARVWGEATSPGPVPPASPVGSVATLQRALGRLSPAPATMLLSDAQAPAVHEGQLLNAEPARISVERPSAHLRTFRQRQGLFELQYPDNWSASAPPQGYGVTIAPRGGLVPTSAGRQRLVCGLVVNQYLPLDGAIAARDNDPLDSLIGRAPLEETTSDLIRQVMVANPNLALVAGSVRHGTISGAPSFSVLLSGTSSVTGVRERVTVLTRPLEEKQVVYMLLVAPVKDYALLAPASDRMVRSLKVNVGAARP